ncbi:hypothetical protein DENSPDRAFT_459594 [Dentipellis sp. KUC8613]|nr:hypothetical protein DENSPDRAFT_459594 [Dentipellis sp. KUC8613]
MNGLRDVQILAAQLCAARMYVPVLLLPFSTSETRRAFEYLARLDARARAYFGISIRRVDAENCGCADGCQARRPGRGGIDIAAASRAEQQTIFRAAHFLLAMAGPRAGEPLRRARGARAVLTTWYGTYALGGTLPVTRGLLLYHVRTRGDRRAGSPGHCGPKQGLLGADSYGLFYGR